MKARPAFTVDINRNGKILSFGCSFLPSEDSGKDAGNIYKLIKFILLNYVFL
jgi:hypothetical protein